MTELDTEKVNKSTFNAQTILAAVSDNTPVAVSVDPSRFIGRTDISDISELTSAAALTILNVESGADVTDATNVAAAGAVMDGDFAAADEIMVGTGVGTHGQITLGASEFLAKKAANAATNVSATDARTILNVEDGSTADQSDAEIKTAIENATSLTLTGPFIHTPSTDTSITAAGGITVTRAIMRIAGDSGAIDITADPQIVAGTDGQIVIIQGTHDTNMVTLDNGTGLALSAQIILAKNDNITLMYDSGETVWIETSRTTVT